MTKSKTTSFAITIKTNMFFSACRQKIGDKWGRKQSLVVSDIVCGDEERQESDKRGDRD